jgi:hypothetical protein
MKKLLSLALVITLSGCVSIESMNADLDRIDQAWDIENKAAIAQRSHIVNADYATAFKVAEKTVADFNMPIVKSSPDKGFIVTKNEAPTPLTPEQWQQVVTIETPKMKKVGGWMYTIPEDPKGQFVNGKIALEAIGTQTKVSIDYYINVPEYEDMGLKTPKNVAPLAEKLACESFWKQFDKNLSMYELHAQ